MAEEELNKTTHGLDPMSSLSLETEFPVWDSVNEDTKKATLQQVKDLIAEGIVAGVSFVGTRAGYETAKLIPVGEEGYIPSKSLVIITDENRTYVTSGTGAEQTLTLTARVMSAGDGITITSDDAIKADTVTFTGTRAQWEALSTAQKAKFNIVNFTDEMECAYQDIYSETEVKTNKVWIDGKPIYKKVINYTTVGQKDITSLQIDTIVNFNYKCIDSGVIFFNGSVPNTSVVCCAYMDNSKTQIILTFSHSDYQLIKFEITLEYTKTTD